MKKIILATAFSLAATTAMAGGMNDAVMESHVTPDVVMDAAVESSGSDDWVGVLMVFLTIVMLGVGG